MRLDKEKVLEFLTENWLLIALYVCLSSIVLFVCITAPVFVFGCISGAAIYANKNKILDWINGFSC